MSFTDPIGDFLTRMRNAQHGRRTDCSAPWSKLKQAICELMKERGYLESVNVEEDGVKKQLIVTFRTDRPALILKRLSTPGARKYVGSEDIRAQLHGNSMAILSTSSGLLTDKEARSKKIGGEIICTVS